MTAPERPWAPGAATGIGSLPGADPAAATRLVFDELPDLPHLPELPARGPGAAITGRTAALLVDLPVEIVPTGWRLAAHDGRDLRRARDFLAYDLDALQVEAAGYEGPLKVQAAGPWTLAAQLELPSGHRAVTDPGAVRDLAGSLAEGLAGHLAEVRARVPGATPVLQLDEPSLPTVLAGRLSTPSGWGTVRAVDAPVATGVLADVLAVADAGCRVVHCCAPEVPVELLRDAGADAVALDLDLVTRAGLDALGEAIEAGTSLWLGIVGADTAPVFDAARARVRRLWDELGFAWALLAASVVPTPACGLAGSTAERVAAVLRTVRDVGRSLVEEG